MSAEKPSPSGTPCLCNALRQASRAVSRLYDRELRGVGLRTTQYSLLSLLHRSGEVRQGDLGPLTVLDETTLTRTLRPLVDRGWVAVRAGRDRRERRVSITGVGTAKLAKARPAWQRAQERLQSSLPRGVWENLMSVLPEVARLTAER
jgi:DNA-binding MarR family transcriptional regulator